MDQEIDQNEIQTQDNEFPDEKQQEEQTSGPALFDDQDEEDVEQTSESDAQTKVDEPTVDDEHKGKYKFANLRQNLKSALKDKRRLERQMEELRSKIPQEAPQLGPKPTLDQFDYDESRFSEAYDKWIEQKIAQDRADQEKLNAQRREQEELENFKKSYKARADALGVDDFHEAESEVGGILNQTQSGLLMRGADDPAGLVYALSKSPERLIELSKISDPVKFTVAIAKLELNLTTRKQSRPAPEPRVSSERSSSSGVASSSQLDRLREKAARTGDYSEVVAYKKQHNIR